MACPRHPHATLHRGRCTVCLFEAALAPAETAATKAAARKRREAGGAFTIQVPLGESASASVFLVRDDGPARRLLRLKIWRTPAPDGFLARFQALQSRLEAWAEDGIVRPHSASLDVFGCPSVLTEFRQGVPIFDAVRSGRLSPEDAVARLTQLRALTLRAHARGLVHGSVVPGNVIVQLHSPSAYLLDFGLVPLFGGPVGEAALASADLEGFAALARTLPGLRPGPAAERSL